MPEARRARRFRDHGGAGDCRPGGVGVAAVSLGAARPARVVGQFDPERVAVPRLLLAGRLDAARLRPRWPPRGRRLGGARPVCRAVGRRAGPRPPEPARSARARAGAGTADPAQTAVGTGAVCATAAVSPGRETDRQSQLRRRRTTEPARRLPAPPRWRWRAGADPSARRRVLVLARTEELLCAATAVPSRRRRSPTS
jgi:hypothetical protein